MDKAASLRLIPADLAPRSYVLLISGTMNPPHRSHIRLGLHAARTLRMRGHGVTAICYVPVHDNYLYNKVALKVSASQAEVNADTMCFPMGQRCQMLQALVQNEDPADAALCHVMDYEHANGRDLLEESPGYWAPKLPGGYLRTVPTTALIKHFAAHSPLLKHGARLGIVFGVDNLAGMSTWNRPAELIAHGDLVLVAREMAKVEFPKDPTDLLRTIKHFVLDSAVPVSFSGSVLFGETAGTFEHEDVSGDAAMYMLPALEGADEHLSSTKIRNAIVGCLDILAEHGYNTPHALTGVFDRAAHGPDSYRAMGHAAETRGERVNAQR
jgi:nicotinic acid mononucleotide adenylyltransferase